MQRLYGRHITETFITISAMPIGFDDALRPPPTAQLSPTPRPL